MQQQVRWIADLETQSPFGCPVSSGYVERTIFVLLDCVSDDLVCIISLLKLDAAELRIPPVASLKYSGHSTPHEMNPDRQEVKKAVGGIVDQRSPEQQHDVVHSCKLSNA
jgi:hypothetical protein